MSWTFAVYSMMDMAIERLQQENTVESLAEAEKIKKQKAEFEKEERAQELEKRKILEEQKKELYKKYGIEVKK